MKRRVLIDIETTALTPQRGEIIRLYARDLNDPSLTFDQLVKPKRPLSKIVQQITEITNEMLQDAPSIEAVMPHFSDFLDHAFIYSYCPCFEQSFLSSFREVAERIKICKR